jgi:hypothetical protein
LRRLTLVFPDHSTVDLQGSKQVRFETDTGAGKTRHCSNIWPRFPMCVSPLCRVPVAHPENLRCILIDYNENGFFRTKRLGKGCNVLEGIARTSALALSRVFADGKRFSLNRTVLTPWMNQNHLIHGRQ